MGRKLVENPNYKTIHNFLNFKFKKPNLCVKCKKKRKLDWALIGKKYTRDIKDYIALCRSCHLSMVNIHFTSIKVRCAVCLKEIYKNLYRIKTITSHHCSRKCYYKHKSFLQKGINNSNYRHGGYCNGKE